MKDVSRQIKEAAKNIGFDLIGFSDVEIDKKAYAHFQNWLKVGAEADLSYMSEQERVRKRKSAKFLMENAKSVISLGINYYHEQKPLLKGHGRIARYSFGRDYHKILKGKLKELEKFLELNFNAKTLSYVDTGPVLERSFAAQSGLGFVGKNSCLITPEFGSWMLLGEIITDLKVQSQVEQNKKISLMPNDLKMGCGKCTRCIDTCPTHAIMRNEKGEYFVDARRCLSYWTIEYKGPKSKIPQPIIEAIKNSKRLYGCDVCQEVCPHNCRAKKSSHKEFTTEKIAGDSQDLRKILVIKSEQEFLKLFAGSPIMRAKLKGLRRTAKIITSKKTG